MRKLPGTATPIRLPLPRQLPTLQVRRGEECRDQVHAKTAVISGEIGKLTCQTFRNGANAVRTRPHRDTRQVDFCRLRVLGDGLLCTQMIGAVRPRGEAVMKLRGGMQSIPLVRFSLLAVILASLLSSCVVGTESLFHKSRSALSFRQYRAKSRLSTVPFRV